MRRQRSTTPGLFALLLGICCVFIGFGGTWTAYGQSAGPTPTPGTISPITTQKSVEPNNGAPGDTLVFTIDIRNTEETPQENVVLRDNIPDFLEVINVTTTKGTATTNGQIVTVDIGTLEVGEVVTITIEVQIRSTAQDGDTAINVAEVSIGPEGNTTNITIPTNPVPVSVNQPPPSGLPNTGNLTNQPIIFLGIGFILCILGATLLFKRSPTHEV